MNVTRISLAVIAAAFITAATAAPADRFPIAIADAEEQAASRFANMDQDGDGAVSLAEFESAASDRPMGQRKRMHRAGRHRGQHPGAQAAREAREADVSAELFAIMDSNDDGVVSIDEHESGATRENRQLAEARVTFKRLDKDGSGALEPGELPSRLARLKSADADGDGLVTREEMRNSRPMRPKRPA